MARRLRIVWHAIKYEWHLKLLALFAAAVFWVYVRDIQDPVVLQQVELPIRTINTPKDLEVLDMTPTQLTVKLRGRESDVGGAKRTIRAYVDLSGQTVGSHDLPIALSNRPQGVIIEGAAQQYARVSLDVSTSGERHVAVEMPGVPADGYQAASPYVFPPVVNIEGPASAVAKVVRVVAVFDVSGLSATTSRFVKVEPRDDAGAPVQEVRLEPESVQVTVPVRPVKGKAVPVWPNLVGIPTGYRVVSVTVRPAVVMVSGPGTTLSTLRSVRTAPVDLAQQKGTSTHTAQILLPSGLTVVGPASAQVTVVLAALPPPPAPTPTPTPAPSAPTTQQPPPQQPETPAGPAQPQAPPSGGTAKPAPKAQEGSPQAPPPPAPQTKAPAPQ